MNEQIELEISFYCDCSICKGQYHDFEYSHEATACLDSIEAGIDEKNQEEMRRKILHDTERNLYRLQVSSHKTRFNTTEKEDQKKKQRKEEYLYKDCSKYTIKDNNENSKKNVHSLRYNTEYCDEYDLREEKKWPFKRQHKRLFYGMDIKHRKSIRKNSHIPFYDESHF
jgi:hypothetical protein